MISGRAPARSSLRAVQQGFTLVELMISLLVLGVLVSIAYPSFVDQMRKSRRADAVAALTAVQQAQERWRGNHSAYANFNTAASGANANGLVVAAHSASNYYTLTISDLSATGYTVVAAAAESSAQYLDSQCRRMGVRATGGNLKYGSGTSSIDWTATNPDAGNCWAR